MTTTNAQVLEALNNLLKGAETPDGNDAAPVSICHQNVSAWDIEGFEVVQSNSRYTLNPGDQSTVSGNEVIALRLEEGYQIIHAAIVRVYSYGDTTQHAVMTVLAKLKEKE